VKIVSWNAQQKFREKIPLFSPCDHDVLVIQECENTPTAVELYRDAGWRHVWLGDNPHKGLGVFVPASAALTPLAWGLDGCDYFLPVELAGGCVLVAVWAMGGRTRRDAYAGQVTRFIDTCRDRIAAVTPWLIGDFNSNAIWDTRHKSANHSCNDARLNSLGLRSLYHAQRGEQNGQEQHPTFYLHRHRHKPYHLDYAYLPEDLIGSASIGVGEPDTWLAVSDHMPLFIEVAG